VLKGRGFKSSCGERSKNRGFGRWLREPTMSGAFFPGGHVLLQIVLRTDLVYLLVLVGGES